MNQDTLTTGDVIVLQEIEVRACPMTPEEEFTIVCIPRINQEEAMRWNFIIFQSLEENHHNFFGLDIQERMRLYEDNMKRILDRIQIETIETSLCNFYGEDRNNWQGKLIHYCFLQQYNAYYQFEL